MRTSSTVVLLCSALSVGCQGVDPAPKDIDGLAHYFWDGFDDEDEALAAGVVNLQKAMKRNELGDGVLDGTITDLARNQLSIIGMDNKNPSKAAGVFIANVINGCTFNEVEESIYALNQNQRHGDTYDRYDREFTSDFDAYDEGRIDELTWQTIYTVTGFGATYTATLDGWLRYVPEIDEELSPHGPALVSRGALIEPAYIEGSNRERGLMQDYQLEVYYQRARREIVHFYVIWRDMQYTGSMDFDNETMQRLVLDGLVNWDEDTAEDCRGS